jgi:putative ABC transport system substrate-binding protein
MLELSENFDARRPSMARYDVLQTAHQPTADRFRSVWLKLRVQRFVVGAVALVLAGCFLWTSTKAVLADEAGRVPRIGELWFQDPPGAAYYQTAYRQGLRELGYVDGKNVAFIARFANGDSVRAHTLVEELVTSEVDVLLVSIVALPSAMQATSTIPIVCCSFYDPVGEGFVTSLARPGRNVTGLSWQSPDAASKRLALMLEMLPTVKTVALLFDASDRGSVLDAEAARTATSRLRLKTIDFNFRNSRTLETALAALADVHPDALLLVHGPLAVQHRERILGFAQKHRPPLISEGRDFAAAGALLTYVPSVTDIFKRCAGKIDRIIKGANPAEVPIEQPTTFDLTINESSARRLGIDIPESIRARADEVIR